MENDEFRMQNGGRKVAISGAPIDAHGCGLSPAESGSEHGIVSRGGHTAGNHLPPSSSIGGQCLSGLLLVQLSNSALNRPKASSWLWSKRLGWTVEMRYV
jgi:hypothetical protein